MKKTCNADLSQINTLQAKVGQFQRTTRDLKLQYQHCGINSLLALEFTHSTTPKSLLERPETTVSFVFSLALLLAGGFKSFLQFSFVAC